MPIGADFLINVGEGLERWRRKKAGRQIETYSSHFGAIIRSCSTMILVTHSYSQFSHQDVFENCDGQQRGVERHATDGDGSEVLVGFGFVVGHGYYLLLR